KTRSRALSRSFAPTGRRPATNLSSVTSSWVSFGLREAIDGVEVDIAYGGAVGHFVEHAVSCGAAGRDWALLGDILSGVPEVQEEGRDDVLVNRCHHAVKARRELLAVRVPASFVHCIGHRVDVERIRGDGEDAHLGPAQDLELRNFVDAIDQGPCGFHDDAPK